MDKEKAAERLVAIEALAKNKGKFINVTFTYKKEEISKNFTFLNFSSHGDIIVRDEEIVRSINFCSIIKMKVSKVNYNFK